MARGSKRSTEWVGSADQSYTVVATNGLVIQQSLAIEAAFGGSTVVRSRGELSIIPTDPSINTKIVGAMGCAVVSDQAAAAGAASIPGPITNMDWDGWFVWVPFHMVFDVTTDIGRAITSREVPFDSKAMRKVKTGDTLVTMVESQVGALSIAITFRTLFKLA